MRSDRTKVVVAGHFAYGSSRIDGQIYRTRLVSDELKDRLGAGSVLDVDTGHLSSRPWSTLRRLWQALGQVSDAVIMPGTRGLKWLLPIYLWRKRRFGLRVHYFVVGGWLPRHIGQHPRLLGKLRECVGVYVQTQRMFDELTSLGLNNVHAMPNFRSFDLKRKVSTGVGEPLRLVFLSRVVPDKGPDLAVWVTDQINKQSGAPRVELDIYGPVRDADRPWLESVLRNVGPGIYYRRVLAPEEIPEVLSRYDAMLFPTSYPGEGFPGVILDAMISGIPVVASDWCDNHEFVEVGRTGLLFRPGDREDLMTKVKWLLDHPDEVRKMKHGAACAAARYHANNVLPPVLKSMGVLGATKGTASA